MSKDFILITGHGIFPKDSVLQVIPNISEDFSVEVSPPDVTANDFIFSIVKTTEINLEIHRAITGGKKDEVEKLLDSQYTRVIQEKFDLTQSEILALLYEGTPDESVTTAIKNYKRRLKKIEDYQQRVAIIQQNPELPDYQSALAAIAKDAPSPEQAVKQQKSLDRIQEHLQEKILEIIEASDGDSTDEDTEEHKLIEMFETEEHSDDIDNRVNDSLASFYETLTGNYVVGYSAANDAPLPTENDVEEFFREADSIKDDPSAISNRNSLVPSETPNLTETVKALEEEESPSED